MIVEISEREEDVIAACIYMAAKEGFYGYAEGRTKIEEILTEFLTKLNYSKAEILELLDER